MVSPDTAHLPATQHTVWLLTTLLTRSTPAIVSGVVIDCPPDVNLCDHVTAISAENGTLLSTLLGTARLFGPTASPVLDARVLDALNVFDGEPMTYLVGSRRGVGAGVYDDVDGATDVASAGHVWHVAGSGWVGAVSDRPLVATDVDLLNPVGPYVAACLAAAQVFLAVRGRDYSPLTIGLDAWSLTVSQLGDEIDCVGWDPASDPAVVLDHVLAGVGAVGSALLATFWACPGVVGKLHAVDADEKGVDATNLNRCVIFTDDDIGRAKATTAATRLSNPSSAGLEITGESGRAEMAVGGTTHLISAVDTPEARGALADRYPASCVQASTRDLRVEMLRVNPTVSGACLRCFNPPRSQVADDDLRAQVDLDDDDAIVDHAEALGVVPHDVRQWVMSGGCGTLGDRMLSRLRPSAGSEAEFSVGFVSVLAGVLLAGQVIKDALRRHGAEPGDRANDGVAETPPLAGALTQFTVNLFAPVTPLPAVRPYSRDCSCPACADGPRKSVWCRRWSG